MAAINFQSKFIANLINETKTSTIRALRKHGKEPCKKGEWLHLYSGMRTKKCQLINVVECISVKRIKIEDEYQDLRQRMQLAKMEGFSGLIEMRQWFEKNHKISQQNFKGWHIIWRQNSEDAEKCQTPD